MSKVALAFLTKDRPELSARTILPLLDLPGVDLFWIDGSTTEEGKALPAQIALQGHRLFIHPNVRGGPDATVAYALTTMLAGDYSHVGLVENDVLLPDDWFSLTMALFTRGNRDGLTVGATSARTYRDRILIQRDGYAVMHNLGWGQQILTKEAALLTLKFMRTGHTSINRKIFGQVASIDLAHFWAFGAREHALCADWGNDAMLAAHGLSSLALTPSHVEMIGQNPPLAEQGLEIVSSPPRYVDKRHRFYVYQGRMQKIQMGVRSPPVYLVPLLDPYGGYTYFPHQMKGLGGEWNLGWKLRFAQGHGPFIWESGLMAGEYKSPNDFEVMLAGPCEFLLSGGTQGGKIHLEDLHSGYEVTPELLPESPSTQMMAVALPPTPILRSIRLTMLSPGLSFWGIRTRDLQPWDNSFSFNWDHLAKP